MKSFTVLATAALLLASANLATAQTAPPPAPSLTAPAAGAAPAPTAAPGKVKKAKVAKFERTRTPESLACSAEADLQALKGDPRKAFRKKCMADAKKAGAAGAPPPALAPAKKN